MTNSGELNSLVVRNIQDLDATAKQIGYIEDQIWKLIKEEAAQWIKDNKWVPGPDPSEPWFGPTDWVEEDRITFTAWFYFDKGPDDTDSGGPAEPHFWLSRYVGQAGGEFCLWFAQGIVKGRDWKALVRASADDLANAGGRISDAGRIFIPCSLNPSAIADAYLLGDFKDALEPIRGALDVAKSLTPIIQQALDRAKPADPAGRDAKFGLR